MTQRTAPSHTDPAITGPASTGITNTVPPMTSVPVSTPAVPASPAPSTAAPTATDKPTPKPLKAPNESKLPKWAQDELSTLRQQIKDLTARCAEMVDAKPTRLMVGYDKPRYFDPRQPVRFYIGKDASDDLTYVEVRISENNNRVYVSGSNSIFIEPMAGNSIIVKLR